MHDNILIVIGSFAVFLIVLILASPTQWRVRNSGTILNIVWLLAGNLTFLINAMVWRDSIADLAPVWCDICKHPLGNSNNALTFSSCENPGGIAHRDLRGKSVYQSTPRQHRRLQNRQNQPSEKDRHWHRSGLWAWSSCYRNGPFLRRTTQPLQHIRGVRLRILRISICRDNMLPFRGPASAQHDISRVRR